MNITFKRGREKTRRSIFLLFVFILRVSPSASCVYAQCHFVTHTVKDFPVNDYYCYYYSQQETNLENVEQEKIHGTRNYYHYYCHYDCYRYYYLPDCCNWCYLCNFQPYVCKRNVEDRIKYSALYTVHDFRHYACTKSHKHNPDCNNQAYAVTCVLK